MVESIRQLWMWVQQLRPWRAFSHFTNVGGSVLTGGMSYQALFAVFAALWLGFGIFGYVLNSRPELLETLVTLINTGVPGLIGTGANNLINPEVLLASRTLTWTSAVAGGSLLWVAMNWFTGTRRAIRLIFGLEVKQYKNAALLKIRDFALSLTFGIAVLISAMLTVFTSNFTAALFGWLGWSPDNWLLSTLGTFARYSAMYVFDVLILIAIHRYLAEVKVPLRQLVLGCLLGGAAMGGVKVLGTSLLGGATSNPLLAGFALLIGLLIWFNIICRVLLLTSAWIATGADRKLGLPVNET